jgi:ferric-dicitrate binding protein FerR (iron transport regulator)
MQRWLLENARLETAAEPTTRRRWWVLALVVAGMLAMLLLWIALSGTAPPLSSDTPPTVTLVATP